MQADSCILIPYLPLKSRRTPPHFPPDPLLAYERYIDSMMCLAELEVCVTKINVLRRISHSTDQGFDYDGVLRSDLDTFVMPGFADWLPPARDKLAVGTGGYGTTNSNAHLAFVSKRLGLNMKASHQLRMGKSL